MPDYDVVVIGAGADGPVVSTRLAREHNLDVLMIEAGPWHGNRNWPEPHVDAGGTLSNDPDDLDGKLLDEQYSHREAEANDPTYGYLRVGPSNSARAPWFRNLHQNAFIWQVSAVGGTSTHYFSNHPRGYPTAFDDQPHWPDEVSYADMVPYYRLNEKLTSTQQAPMTAREEVFIEGASQEKNGEYPLLDGLNVTETGWRPQPNAVEVPGKETSNGEPLDSDYEGSFSYDDGFRGDTLVGDHFQGSSTPVDAPVREKARKSSNIGYVPRALDTNENPNQGNVAIRPNTYVTDVHTAEGAGNLEATGVEIRDTWSGATQTVEADTVVLAGGCIETPRLWLNSGLPDDGWVGKGLTTHWFDWVVGVYDDDTVADINPEREHMDPYVGQNSAVRFDKPGVGGLEDIGMSPGLVSFADYLFTEAGYSFDTPVDPDEPWDTRGYIVGKELKRRMANYRQTKAILVLTDDMPRQENGVSLDDTFSDEHGPVPKVRYEPGEEDDERRDELARIAANIHRNAGASHVHRAEWPPLLLHMQSSMRIGKVLDFAGEAKNVDRLFVADHSALANGVGGPNPTNSGQANALRIADHIGDRYF